MKKIPFFALFFCLSAFSARAFTLEHDFKVQIGPFDASRTLFRYGLDKDNYLVSSEVKTSGLFDTLYPFRAEYATTGKINGKNLETRSYKYASKSRFSRRTKELVYNESGQPVYRLSSKNGKEKRVDIEQSAEYKGTTDLQTVFAELARQYNELGFCAARMEVFDGKRRFDVIFEDQGRENLSKAEDFPFEGEAAKCSMYIDKLNSDGDDLLWQLSSDKPIYFWIMKDSASGLPFIAQIKIDDTPLGRLDVKTQKITVKKD